MGLQLPLVNVDGIESMLRPLPNASDICEPLSNISSSGIITVENVREISSNKVLPNTKDRSSLRIVAESQVTAHA